MQSTAATGRLETPATTQQRWIGVGSSGIADSVEAGRQAARDALRGDDPKLLVTFVSPAHDLHALLGGVREICSGVPLIGCSSSGEIATSGPGDASVVITALGGPGFSVATAAGRNASADLRTAGAAAAACAEDAGDKAHRILLLLTDGLAGDQQEIVRGAYSVVGAAVPLVGGCAGDDLAMRKTFQLFDGEVLEDAVIAAAISSDAPFGIGVQHGWRRVGNAMLVSESVGNRVISLDDQPALDVYLDRLGAPQDVRTDPAAFTRFALTHPFGVSRRSGEEVRFIAGADFAERSINCIAEVPQGGLTWIMEGDDASVLQATDAACTQALEALHGEAPLGFLAFDCIARRGVLGPGIESEVQRIVTHSGGAPVAGFYTYGEIARTHGMGGFHNQTLVVLAFS